MDRKPELLIIDAGPLEQPLGRACEAAGMGIRACTSDRVAFSLGTLLPDIALVCGELSSEAAARVLSCIADDAALASVAVVLLARETGERRFLKGTRTGLVELLPAGLPAPAYVARLKALLHELPQRSGVTSGEAAASGELACLISHVKTTRRSGALRLNPGTREAGLAVFMQGELRTARFGAHSGEQALEAMRELDAAKWSFTDVGGGGGEGAGVVIDVVAAPREPVREAPPVLQSATPATILVVDDDPVVGRFLSVVFEKSGYQVSVARDGFAGYQAAVDRRFDLITADLKLPRLDGWGMLRLLREDHRTREVPLAFLSCDDLHRDQLSRVERGAQAFLPKDMGMDALVQQVGALLEPRLAFRREVAERKPLQTRFGALGPQWVLHELSRTRASARIAARDAWASYELYFQDGQLVHAKADTGKQQLDRTRALMAWILSRAAEGAIFFGSFPVARTLQQPLLVELDAANASLNERDRAARVGALSSEGEVEVNTGLYELYAEVAPQAWQPVAQLVCKDRVPPGEVASRVSIPAAEVQEALKDLFRRGVVSLRKSA